MLTSREIESLVRRIVQRLRPRKVIMFGSYAKGTATARSDLDIFVMKDTDLPMGSRGQALGALLAAQLIPVDVHIYTLEEVEEYAKEPFSFVSSILSTGRVVYDELGDWSPP